MLGIYVNEMQRSINGAGLGCQTCTPAGGYYDTHITPYGHFALFHPGTVARVPVHPDIGLGDVPNDFEASVDLQYIPVRQGWYYGYPVDGSGYPDGGLGRTTTSVERRLRRRQFGQAAATAAAADPVALASLAKMEKIQTVLQVVSTLSIATVATFALVKAVRSRGRQFSGDED